MITVKNIAKHFGERQVFTDFSITFETGKIYALIGNSGKGKTTLLNMIAKLETYDKGSIIYDNQELKQIKTNRYFKDTLGYLFQNFGLLENDSIRENLDLGLIGKRLSKSERKSLQLAALSKVGLEYLRLEQKIYTLSGGEAQRVALAKIILKDPPLILADEPTAALDETNATELMNLLIDMKNDKRIIIIATHNKNVWQRTDKIIAL
ncbi:putative bacteriocin export ABC transporter [Streptococcus sciuri]|uniref:Bacteriocin export ABC transporter n=1 Tax=Streptococcus sciuri TaxID=2973939 RepID=A0ABT2F8A1_9STRE|nr:putative bacteriocin export ABC transporter [Streptococcus sciuri]MCS4488703.1 putative bacteriocin export ABC transporter [Streptococcus sciuri]